MASTVKKDKGLFITLEGGDGTGKTTIIQQLLPLLTSSYGDMFSLTREPGGHNVKIAEQIREIVLSNQNREMAPETEVYLYAASRAQHMQELIMPELNRGRVVISDRFIDSSLVYQGIVRGVGIDSVMTANELALKGRLPDITIVLTLPPEIALARMSADRKRVINRLDQESNDFHHEVQKAYQKLAKLFPDRIRVINANDTPEKVAAAIMEAITDKIKKWQRH